MTFGFMIEIQIVFVTDPELGYAPKSWIFIMNLFLHSGQIKNALACDPVALVSYSIADNEIGFG